MKTRFFSFLIALAAMAMLFTGCKKETEEQTADSPIVGTWLANENSFRSQTFTDLSTGEVHEDKYSLKGWKVTFNADGTCSEGSWTMSGNKLTLNLYSEIQEYNVLKLDDKSLIIEKSTEQEVGGSHSVLKTHYELDKQ